MQYAVVRDNMVDNVIIGKTNQQAELSTLIGAEIVDASEFNLQIGDLRVNGVWTRNVGGEQVVLDGQPTYDDLTQTNAEQAEALAILGVTV